MTRYLAAALLVLCLPPSELYAQSTMLTVNATSATVHKSPSVGSPVVGRAARGQWLEVTRELGDWVKVSWPDAEDGVGYVHLSMGRLVRNVTAPRSTGGAPVRRPGPSSPMPSSSAPATDFAGTQTRIETAPATVYVAPPTHFVGVGGRMTGAAFGVGATARVWSRGPLGAQFDLSRVARTSAFSAERVTSIQMAPAVLYGFADFVTDHVWMRPYAGAGASIQRHTRNDVTPGVSESANEFSYQVFGGVELTFPGIPRVAFSVDLGHDWSKSPYAGYDVGGANFALSGRWYFK